MTGAPMTTENEIIQLRKRDLARALWHLFWRHDNKVLISTKSWPHKVDVPFGRVVKFCGDDWRFVIGDGAAEQFAR